MFQNNTKTEWWFRSFNLTEKSFWERGKSERAGRKTEGVRKKGKGLRERPSAVSLLALVCSLFRGNLTFSLTPYPRLGWSGLSTRYSMLATLLAAIEPAPAAPSGPSRV